MRIASYPVASSATAAAKVLLAVLGLASLACDSDGVFDPNGARIRLINNIDVRSDTVHAVPSELLVVEALDDEGEPVPSATVRFRVREAEDLPSSDPARGMYVCFSVLPRCSDFPGFSEVEVSADENGRASVRVQFGIVAGPSVIEVSHRDREEALALSYTTRAGALAGARFSVQDTAVYVGATYTLVASGADRFGNARAEAVTLSALDPAVATLTGQTVTATGIGRGRIRAQSGAVVDTAFVSVPPPGRLVGMWTDGPLSSSELTLVNTNGSARRSVLATIGVGGFSLPAWTPNGAGIVIQQQDVTGNIQHLRALDTLGGQRPFLADQANFSISLQPTLGGDGSIYFLGQRNAPPAGGIFRASADGTGSTFVFEAVQPGPSPDGSMLAFVRGDGLFVRNLGTGVETVLGSHAELPRWSPAGDWIAYKDLSGARLMLVRPNGTGHRQIGNATVFDNMIAWSPDGQWAAFPGVNGFIEIIRISDGERLPIPGTAGFSQLAWRP